VEVQAYALRYPRRSPTDTSRAAHSREAENRMGILQTILRRKPAPVPQAILERRRCPRYDVNVMSTMYWATHPMQVVLMDISRHGAKIGSRFPREDISVFGLQVSVDGHTMKLPLRVVWERFNEGLYEFGGEFVELTEAEQTHVDRFVEAAQRHCKTTRRLDQKTA